MLVRWVWVCGGCSLQVTVPKPGFTGAPARVTETVFDHMVRVCPERTAREDGELATTQKMGVVVLTYPGPLRAACGPPLL